MSSEYNRDCSFKSLVQFSSVQLLSHVQLFVTPWTAARQVSLSITSSWRLLKLMSIELVMPSNHLILCYPLLLPSSIFPSIRVQLLILLIYFLVCVKVQWTYSVMLVSGVPPSDTVTHIHMCMYVCVFQILFPYRL